MLPIAALPLAAMLSLAMQPLSTPNLIANPGFEAKGANGMPSAWSSWGEVWQPDSTIKASGQVSARYRNSDPNRYVLMSQPVAAQAGRRYRLQCRIKTDDIQGDETGATMCIEWSDAKGAYLGGDYPAGFKGTNDWRTLDVVSQRIPAAAAHVTATVYVRKGMTGTAWFDDVSVVEEPDPAFQGTIGVPGYRGVMAGDGPMPVVVRGWMGADEAHPLSARKLVAEIVRDGTSKALVHREVAAPAKPEVEVSLPTASLPDGRYTVRVQVLAKGVPTALAEQTAPLVRQKAAPKVRVFLRPDGVALLDGKPFFPIGVYEGASPSDPASLERLREIAAMGFNCVMNYGINSGSLDQIRKYLDTAESLHLKVIYSLKDVYEGSTWPVKQVGEWKGDEAIVKGVVRTFRDHPAILAWYLNDELALSWHDRLVRNYRWVRELDPNHPAWVVLYQVNDLDGYGDTTDVMGVDPYPLPNAPLTMVSDWTKRAAGMGMPIWIVPQLHDIALYEPKEKSHPPSLDEMRAMTWQALAHGANGLVFYSFFDLKRGAKFEARREDVKKIVAEVKRAVPWLIGAKRGQPRVQSGLITQQWVGKTDGLFVSINPTYQPIEAEVELSAGFERATPLFDPDPPRGEPKAGPGTWKPLEVQIDRLHNR